MTIFWSVFSHLCTQFYICNTVALSDYCNDVSAGTGPVKATFSGQSVIQYSNTLLNSSREPVVTLSLRLRSRDLSATILCLRHTVSSWFICVHLFGGKLQVQYNLNTSLWLNANAFVADGIWHDITLTFVRNLTSLTIDGNSTDSWPIAENQLRGSVDNSSEVFIGADAERQNHFKGCLDEVRINSFLLPFFARAELANDTSVERFDVVSMTDIRTGCHGDDICNSTRCENGGMCHDVWNAHVCDCAAGFNGTFCELNIDECVIGNKCANGATCVDGIASYSCICSAGFTGPRYAFLVLCTSINCLSVQTFCWFHPFGHVRFGIVHVDKLSNVFG